MKRQLQLFLLFGALLMAACGNESDSDESPASTATPATPAESSATATSTTDPADTPTAGPSATATGEPTATPPPTVAVHPEGARTGVPAVDEFLEVHEAGDAAAMAELLIYRDHACLPPETAEYQVACPEGVEEGAPVSAFTLSACHGGWVGEDGRRDLAAELLEREVRVHSVVAVQGHFAIADGDDDARDIVLVTASRDKQNSERQRGIAYHFAEGGGLVTIANGCWHQVEDMLSQFGYEDGEVLFAAP